MSFEKISETVERVKYAESNVAAKDMIFSVLRDMLRAHGVYFTANDIQAIEIYRDDEYIVIEFYLNTIEIWVKIYRDGYVDAHIRPILNCNCSCE